MTQQIPLSSDHLAELPDPDAAVKVVTSDLSYRRLGIVNVVFFRSSPADTSAWVLVDAGVAGTAGLIAKAAADQFGAGTKPSAILLTHGHFDHVGALTKLSEQWDVPVFAHPLEIPYLNGTQSYQPPDPTAGGGMMSLLSPLYPRKPVDVSQRLRVLPEDGTVPGMPGWRWIETPGHTPGHVSFWREADRTLIAGDAFITTAQESAYAVLTQKPEMHGPPRYFTPDWTTAAESVRKLAALDPERVITGHGPAMQGAGMRVALHQLADQFEQVAVPAHRPRH